MVVELVTALELAPHQLPHTLLANMTAPITSGAKIAAKLAYIGTTMMQCKGKACARGCNQPTSRDLSQPNAIDVERPTASPLATHQLPSLAANPTHVIVAGL
jgi:hypothetical protein